MSDKKKPFSAETLEALTKVGCDMTVVSLDGPDPLAALRKALESAIANPSEVFTIVLPVDAEEPPQLLN